MNWVVRKEIRIQIGRVYAWDVGFITSRWNDSRERSDRFPPLPRGGKGGSAPVNKRRSIYDGHSPIRGPRDAKTAARRRTPLKRPPLTPPW